MSLIACVPNISEGRDKDVIMAIADAIASIRSVKVLDITWDGEHNRTVYTFIGPQTALVKACSVMVGEAIKLIDLNKHEGLHPRIGSVDVIPFVPLYDTPMEKAIALAKKTGRVLADHYGLPIYMYDYAANSEDRRSVNRIREGEFENFHKKINLPEWEPDYGPKRVHATAGVTAVGARYPLIALNAVIKCSKPDIVESIANSMTEKHYDRRLVKTSLIETAKANIYKIAVSLLNYKTIPLCEIVNTLMEETKKHGADYEGTELVGLVTGDALFDCLKRQLKLKDFNHLQILDFHLPNKLKY